MDQQSDGPRIFFVHVMKSGGTSLSRILNEAYRPHEFYPNPADDNTTQDKVSPHRLLQLPEATRQAIRCFSVHQPGWVAERVAPDALHLTVLREPVARTISHLRHLARFPNTPDDLSEIYAHPGWRRRLSNYQTRLFSLDGPEPTTTPDGPKLSADDLTEDELQDLRDGVEQFLATGILRAEPLVPRDLERALTRLARFDLVGTTERLDETVDELRRRTGLELRGVPQANEARTATPPTPGLVEAIRVDNELDVRLYEQVAGT